MKINFDAVYSAVAASLTVSSVVGAIAVAFMSRVINSKFDKQLEVIKAKNAEQLAQLNAALEGTKESSKQLSQLRVHEFRAMCEAAYRAKNEIRGLIEAISDDVLSNDASISDLTAACEMHAEAVAELCFKNRFLLSDRQFALVHDFKNTLKTAQRVIEVERNFSPPTILGAGVQNALRHLDDKLAPLIKSLQEVASGSLTTD